MYTEQDMAVIQGRIRKNWAVLTPVLLAILAVYVYAMASAKLWLAMAAGPLLFVAACYGAIAYLMPNYRYRSFLLDMENGLSRDVKGEVVEIAAKAEPQDGAWVLPVRVRLDPDAKGEHAVPQGTVEAKRLKLESAEDDEDERIVYLNVSKRDRMPGAGERVLLHCFGRHIRDVERVG